MLVAAKSPIPNRLLAALPRQTYQRIKTDLEPVTLSFGDQLHEPGHAIRHIYFPSDCLVSLITFVGPGKGAEVGLVGSEGMIGIPIALGINVSPVLAVVQGKGTAMRMKTALFRRHLGDNGALQRALFGFTHLLMNQIAQTAACNSFHTVNQRLARWLLMTSDRVKSNDFELTQEFLAKMLGVRRVGVTTAASALQKRKVIGYSRGNISILDRPGLEASACSCYAVVKKLYAQSYTKAWA